MLSGDAGVVVADASQVVVAQNDFDTQASNDNEQSLVGFYDPATGFDLDSDINEEASEVTLEDDVSTEDEATSETALKSEALEDDEVIADSVPLPQSTSSAKLTESDDHDLTVESLAEENDSVYDSTTTKMVSTLNVANAPPVAAADSESDLSFESHISSLRTSSDSFSAIMEDFRGLDFLNTDIFGTRLSINQLIGNIDQFLDLGSALDSYLDQVNASTASLEGYLDYRSNSWLSNSPFQNDESSALLAEITDAGFTLSFDDILSLNQLAALSLGTEAEELGLIVDSSLDFSVDADLEFSVSFDLSDGSVVFDLQNFGLSAAASSTNLIVQGRVGPLDASIGESGDEGSASIDLTGDISYDGTSFSVTSATSSVDLDLPFFVTLGGSDLTAGSSPRFVASGDFLLDVNDPGYIQVTTNGFDNLADFSNLDFSQVSVAIRDVSNWLADLSESSFFDLEIPYVDLNLAEVVQFSKAYADDIVIKLDFNTINSVQELATAFASEAILPDGLEIGYDADEGELILPLRFSEIWTLSAQTLMFGDNLSEADLGLSTQASVVPEITISGGLDVIFDLDGSLSLIHI